MCVCSMLPKNVSITGYARSKLSDEDLREKVREHLEDDEQSVVNSFLDLLTYTAGCGPPPPPLSPALAYAPAS